jgi:hypothetical protein
MDESRGGVQRDRLYDGKEDVRPSRENSGHFQTCWVVSWLQIGQT